MTVNFSAKDLAFYPDALKLDYDRAGSWPGDAIPVSEAVYLEFSGAAPAGKRLVVSAEGLPAWGDVLPPTHDEQVKAAVLEKESLRSRADAIITPLQDAVDLDIATSDEAAGYSAWRKYRVLLNRVDTSSPDDIHWPDMPE
ncbi:tail fiber assembly protein [Erwinia persicina]|uniref:tail fiber assembly protein n=1 Tax=Erwinia persicina TaxID=55211 RepID=UPI001786426F|nr:tail fiber assembly protein [Erwinia persicina]MBD8169523.1 tail fiber assembly protein [Erwinia persicina]